MVYLQTDCLKTDVKYGTNRKEDVMFNGNMRVSQPHASKSVSYTHLTLPTSDLV